MLDQGKLLVAVDTYKDGALESHRTVDHDSRDDRVWMGKHCFWAMRNGREVRTYAIEKGV